MARDSAGSQTTSDKGLGVELSTIIRQLRSELTVALADGQDQSIRFGVESIELELEVAVKRDVDPRIGVKFWVLDAGVSGKLASAKVQKLKLKLSPKGPEGVEGDLLIAKRTTVRRG